MLQDSEFEGDEREVIVEHDKATAQEFELDDPIVNVVVGEWGTEITVLLMLRMSPNL